MFKNTYSKLTIIYMYRVPKKYWSLFNAFQKSSTKYICTTFLRHPTYMSLRSDY